MIRIEKGTPNKNAFITLLVGMVIGLLILVGLDPAIRVYDQHIRTRPWLSATIDIISRRDGGKPDLIYAVSAPAYVEGRWKAWPEIQLSNGEFQRRAGGEGTGTYGPRTGTPKSWGWNAFFEADRPEPLRPYRVCVAYDVRTARGVPGDFGPFCSAVYDPKGEMQ
ncbi:MAG: hypothetical protein ACPG61_07095 [Paracoccaceae bacterium]